MYPVRIEVSEDIGESIKQVKESIRMIPNKGIGYGAIEGYDIEKLPKISFNYLGQFEKVEGERGEWEIVDEGIGEVVDERNEDENIIEINGLVIGGKLRFEMESKLSEEETNKIGKIFKEKLLEIVEYNREQNRGYLTVSDISKIISEDYLEKIQERKK